jgi:hypothetical protein
VGHPPSVCLGSVFVWPVKGTLYVARGTGQAQPLARGAVVCWDTLICVQGSRCSGLGRATAGGLAALRALAHARLSPHPRLHQRSPAITSPPSLCC